MGNGQAGHHVLPHLDVFRGNHTIVRSVEATVTQVLGGSYQMIDTSTIMHMTAAELAAASDKMIACGGWNIDEIRRKSGDAILNTEWSKRHFLTKNYEEMKALEDGSDPPGGGEDTNKINEGGSDEDNSET